MPERRDGARRSALWMDSRMVLSRVRCTWCSRVWGLKTATKRFRFGGGWIRGTQAAALRWASAQAVGGSGWTACSCACPGYGSSGIRPRRSRIDRRAGTRSPTPRDRKRVSDAPAGMFEGSAVAAVCNPATRDVLGHPRGFRSGRSTAPGQEERDDKESLHYELLRRATRIWSGRKNKYVSIWSHVE